MNDTLGCIPVVTTTTYQFTRPNADKSDELFMSFVYFYSRYSYLSYTLTTCPDDIKNEVINIMSDPNYETLFGDDPAPAILQLENNANI